MIYMGQYMILSEKEKILLKNFDRFFRIGLIIFAIPFFGYFAQLEWTYSIRTFQFLFLAPMIFFGVKNRKDLHDLYLNESNELSQYLHSYLSKK